MSGRWFGGWGANGDEVDWGEFEALNTTGAVHVTPINDVVAHDETGGALCDCVCGPDVEFVKDGGVLVSHHSLDGREKKE